MNEELDEIVSRFEMQWRSGGEPSIEEAVAGGAESEQTALIALLVAKDCRFRKAKKQLVNFDDYAARFPSLVDSAGEWHPDFMAALEATSASQQVQRTPEVSLTVDTGQEAAEAPALVFQGGEEAGGGEAVSDIGIKIPGYLITDRLGEGGMGVVWKATQLATKRQVALKCAAGRNVDSPRARATFEREVELAAMLEHPNIARVYDSGIYEGVYYYALELLDGDEMDVFAESRGLSEVEVVALMMKVCHAVEVAHQRGVIHRDLKPGNIMVTGDGEPHVLDFGLAKSLEGTETNVTMTQEGSVSGTLAFMAPEQAMGSVKDMDTRTDVYALGAILYQLLVGQPQQSMKDGQVAILRRIAEEEVIRPRSVKPELDGELEAILLKALSRESNERYRSAGDLGEELERYLEGSPISAAPATMSYFLKKRLRKHKLGVGLALAAMLAVMCAIGFYIFSINAEKARTEAQKEIADKKAEEAAESARIANEKAEAARRTVYFNDVALALSEYRKGNISQAKEILYQCPEDLRRWEWYFMDRVSTVPRHDYKGIPDVVYAIRYSPDGKLVAAYSRAGVLGIWRRGEKKPFLKFDKFGGMAGMRFTPDGKYLLCRSYDAKRIDVRQTTDFEVVKSLEAGTPWSFSISPDAKLLAFANRRKRIELRKIPSLELVKELPHDGPAHFLPDGKLMVRHGGFRTVDVATGKVELIAAPPVFKGGSWFLPSPSGEIIYQPRGQVIDAWDRRTGEVLFSRQVNGEIGGFRVSPDGRLIVYPNWKSVFLYDAYTGEQLRVYRLRSGHNFYTTAFSPDMKQVSVGFMGAVFSWPLQIEQLSEGWLPTGGHNRAAGRILGEVSSRARWAAVFGSRGKRMTIKDLRVGADHLVLEKNVDSIGAAFSPDEEFVLRAGHGRRLELTELATGKQIWEAELIPSEKLKKFSIRDVAMSASGRQGFVLFQWTDSTGKVYEKVQAREMESGKLLWGREHPMSEGKHQIEVSGGGEHIYVSTRYGFRKLNAKNGELVREYAYYKGRYGDSVLAMALSPNEKMMLLACSSNGSTVLVDLEDWETKFNLLDHDFSGSACAWSADSDRFFTGSLDHKIFVWDAVSGRRIMSLDNEGHVDGLAFSPDGRDLISFGGVTRGQRIKRWRSGPMINRRENLMEAVGDQVIESGSTLDLIRSDTPLLSAKGGEFVRDAAGLKIHQGKGYPGVTVPVRLLGSYSLKGEMENSGRFVFHLPVGESEVRWFLKERASFLDTVDGETESKSNPTYSLPFESWDGKRSFKIDVDIGVDSVRIVAQVEGRKVIDWTGAAFQLASQHKDSLFPGVVDLFSFGQGVAFSKLELTVKDGLAYHLAKPSNSSSESDVQPVTPPAKPNIPYGKWINLFDGRSLKGWRPMPAMGQPSAKWSVRGGWIVCDDAGFLATEAKLWDYEIEFEWMADANADGGVMYRVGADVLQAPEFQIIDNLSNEFGKVANKRCSSLFGVLGPKGDVLRPSGFPNVGRIVCRGFKVEHWLNGKRVLAYSTKSPEIQKTQWAGNQSGHIVLQQWTGGRIRYRNIRIRDL